MSSKSVDQLLKERKIHQIINPKLVQAPPEMTVKDAAELMRKIGSSYIVVAKNKKVVGMFTETDFVQKILEKDIDWTRPISDFMTPDPKVLTPEDSVGSAIDLMGQHRFYHIPLVNAKNELVNVISVRTLIRFLAECYPAEILNLPPHPNQVMASPEGG
jgi:CBS domain-containing protein